MSLLTEAKKYVSLSIYMIKMHILTELEYRANFVVKISFMLISNFGLLAMWIIYFHEFPSINGWKFSDTLTLYSLNLFIFSIFSITCYGLLDLAKYVAHGNLDYFLTLPKSVLWQVSLSRIAIETSADLIFGVGIFFLTQQHAIKLLPIYLLVSIIAALILYNITVIIFSVSFYLSNFEESSERWFWTVFGFTLYPQSFFSGWLKLITLTVIPVFFIVALPVNIVQTLNIKNIFYMLGFWLITLILALFIFNRGLKRYESGNLINVKM